MANNVSAPPKLVTLDPTDPRQHDLCRVVVDMTDQYLHRQPLPRFRDPVGKPRTREWLLWQGKFIIRNLRNQLISLAYRYPGSENPVTLRQACEDWTTRRKALEDQDTRGHAAYFAVLDELLDDLVRPAFEPAHRRAVLEPHYVAILLSRTPTAMYMRMQTYHPCPDAPMTLRTHMWDQPELRQWLRFTPLVTFPTQDIGLPLLWARSQQDQHASITDYFENLVSCLQKRLTLEVRGHADYFLAFEELASGTAWLTSTQVSDWYHIIPFNEQKAFSKWTVNLHNSIQASLDKAGGLIMLSHLLAWDPKMVQQWMRYSCGDSAADANPFPGSPADLKQKGDWTWACPEFNAFLPPPTPGVEPAPRDPGAGHVQVLLPH